MRIVTAKTEVMELLGHEVNAVRGDKKALQARLVHLAEMGCQVSLVTMANLGSKAHKALLGAEGTLDHMAHQG